MNAQEWWAHRPGSSVPRPARRPSRDDLQRQLKTARRRRLQVEREQAELDEQIGSLEAALVEAEPAGEATVEVSR